MSLLKEAFVSAQHQLRDARIEISLENKGKLYGYYKIAHNELTADDREPFFFSFMEKGKWDARVAAEKECQMASGEEHKEAAEIAMQKYIELLETILGGITRRTLSESQRR